jgi:autotransporter family porin
MSTAGDETSDAALCDLIGLNAPCPQSHGLLQVKGTVHEGTYPASTRASAFGVDYAMSWLRACYEGSFTWLGDDYGPGDEWGCIGAWFSGNWWDQGARKYVAEVQGHVAGRTWMDYRP